jgi:hypothetical protein
MNKFQALLILVYSSIAVTSTAQEFAPIGAVWHVETREPFDMDYRRTLTNVSLRDTLVKGLNCKILEKSQATIFNPIIGEYVLCQEGDSIFHFIESLDTFNLVMDFGAEVGESWESFDLSHSFVEFGFRNDYLFEVDSIGDFISEDMDTLKTQFISIYRKKWDQPPSAYDFIDKTKLIEYIGFEDALLKTNGGDGFTDDVLETQVRCYEDANVGLLKLSDNQACILSSLTEYDVRGAQQLYPNPNDGVLYINEPVQGLKYRITTSQGQLIVQGSYSSLGIRLPYQGLFLVTLISGDREWTERVVRY